MVRTIWQSLYQMQSILNCDPQPRLKPIRGESRYHEDFEWGYTESDIHLPPTWCCMLTMFLASCLLYPLHFLDSWRKVERMPITGTIAIFTTTQGDMVEVKVTCEIPSTLHSFIGLKRCVLKLMNCIWRLILLQKYSFLNCIQTVMDCPTMK